MVPHPAYAYAPVPASYLHSPVHGPSPWWMQNGNPAALAQQVQSPEFTFRQPLWTLFMAGVSLRMDCVVKPRNGNDGIIWTTQSANLRRVTSAVNCVARNMINARCQ